MTIRCSPATAPAVASALLSMLLMTSTATARALERQESQGVVVVRSGEWTRDRSNPVQLYPLTTGGVLRHEQYDGVVRRIDASGREVARVKVPATSPFFRFRTELVLSKDHSRVLAIYTDSDETMFRAKHRMLLLETSTLRVIDTLRLGMCESVFTLPVSAEALTLLCQHSQNPHQPSVKPTLALLTLDVKEGRVTRWFALGGKRRVSWPGYYYEVKLITIRPVTRACEELNPPAPLSQDAGAAETLPYPDMVFALSRREPEPRRWEVWGVSSNVTDTPRRIAVLSGTPGPRVSLPAILCNDPRSPSSPTRPPRFLYVTMNRQAPAERTDQVSGFRDSDGFDIVVIDVVTGRIVTPSDVSKRF